MHSFAGLGIQTSDKDALLNKLKKNRYAKARWIDVEVLIIDEISMVITYKSVLALNLYCNVIQMVFNFQVDGNLFDSLEWIARQLRKNEEPFGGIQVLCLSLFLIVNCSLFFVAISSNFHQYRIKLRTKRMKFLWKSRFVSIPNVGRVLFVKPLS